MIKKSQISKLIKTLKSSGLVAMSTDTIWGVLGQALDENTVQRIYKLKGRDPKKPLIILISDMRQLGLFGIKVNADQSDFLDRNWPGPVSVILECVDKKFEYLTRGTKTLAFRLPKNESLQCIIKETGPLVAPSANPEGLPPATTAEEARMYFADKVDYYQESSNKTGNHSTIVFLGEYDYEIIREGAAKIS